MNGIIEAEFVSAENVVVQGVSVGPVVSLPDEGDTELPMTRAVLIDMPMLRDDHDDFGFYAAIGSNKSYWTQGRLEVSPDGVSFGTLAEADDSAIIGDVVGVLPEGTTTGWDDTLDTTSVVTVVLLHESMTLVSATDAELDGWANLAYIGKDGQGEYLQFKTATQVDTATWELSDLRRGRRGTDWAMDAHVADEEFALLSGPGMYRMPYTDGSSWGDEHVYRAVTLHQDPLDADTILFTNTGEGKRPFSPIELEGEFDGSGNLDLIWTDRSRFFVTDTDVPVTFEIDFKRLGVVERTETVTPAEAYTYAVADQASDGFTAGDAIVVELYRVNDDYGRSRVRRAAFLQPAFTLHLEDDVSPMLMEDDLTPIGLG